MKPKIILYISLLLLVFGVFILKEVHFNNYNDSDKFIKSYTIGEEFNIGDNIFLLLMDDKTGCRYVKFNETLMPFNVVQDCNYSKEKYENFNFVEIENGSEYVKEFVDYDNKCKSILVKVNDKYELSYFECDRILTLNNE